MSADTLGLAKRRRAERAFRALGISALAFSALGLIALFGSISLSGFGAFWTLSVRVDVHYDAEFLEIDDPSDVESIELADFGGLLRRSLRAHFPEVADRSALRRLDALLSDGAEFLLRERFLRDPAGWLGEREGVWLPASHALKSHWRGDEGAATWDERERAWVERLGAENRLRSHFDWRFFTAGDSRSPEIAGIFAALVGSFLTLSVTLALSFPIGIVAAIYLQEFAPRNRWTDLVEININNLAAVPSIIFGLLGLAVLINFLGMPRSAPVVGGVVLALMTLPTIIIASRSAIGAVPQTIRDAALALGASKTQAVFSHVLPQAMPGMLTGTIIGMSGALGETAPLLMIGMVAFIANAPQGIDQAATVLPVQIYLWAGTPERGFVERAAAAIMVLLAFLVCMNGVAIWLRARMERRR